MRSVITAKIDDDTLRVLAMDPHDIGRISVGSTISGSFVENGTVIVGQILGHPGGIGSYLINKPGATPIETMRFVPSPSASEDATN